MAIVVAEKIIEMVFIMLCGIVLTGHMDVHREDNAKRNKNGIRAG